MDGTTIEVGPPLSDRTLKYGRNVMAVSGVILALSWIPHIKVGEFSPFGLKLPEGGEIYIWSILGIVLVYYAVQFGVAGVLDYRAWHHTNTPIFDLRTPQHPVRQEESRALLAKARGHRVSVFLRFLILDVAFPAVMFLAALDATYQQVAPLVLPPPPPAIHT